MSQTESKVEKLTIRNRPGAEGKVSVGANVEVLLDGKKLKGITFLKFEVKAKGIAKVQMEMFAEVDVEANVELEQSAPKETDLKIGGKPVALHTLSNYAPVALATKTERKCNCTAYGQVCNPMQDLLEKQKKD